jgi:hypothetical protein
MVHDVYLVGISYTAVEILHPFKITILEHLNEV